MYGGGYAQQHKECVSTQPYQPDSPFSLGEGKPHSSPKLHAAGP